MKYATPIYICTCICRHKNAAPARPNSRIGTVNMVHVTDLDGLIFNFSGIENESWSTAHTTDS